MKKAIKTSKKYLITISSFAIILVACVGATIGITMAYFGDVKNGSADITLSAGITFDGTSGISVSAGDVEYAVPSQTVTVTTSLKIVKGTGTKATNAVLQVAPTFTATGLTGVTCDFTDGNKYAVTGLTGAQLLASGNRLYLVKTDTTDLFEFEPTDSGVTISFTIDVQIPSTIGNTAGGKSCSLSITAKVLQSTIYTDATNTVEKTITGFADYFSGFNAAA